MEDRTFSTNNNPTNGFSDTFRQFIEALVEEVTLNGEPFDAQKKWLRKHSEAEGLDYKTLESSLTELFEAIEELEEHESKFAERSIRLLAKECYLSEALVNKLVEHTAKVRTEAVERATDELNVHEYVDLGLPSGTLWATCNVGATKPEEYGDYFAWGEINTKSTYNWQTYKYANGDCKRLTKYCSHPDFGNNCFSDKLTTLQSGDDPATANWGDSWHTPSKTQWEELLLNTTNQWTVQDGMCGWRFTAKNGQTLFLPAAGARVDNSLYYAGSRGHYLSSSLATSYPHDKCSFDFDSSHYGVYDSYIRSNGSTVRPVRN